MASKKKDYPVHLRQTVKKHYRNADSEQEIAQKLIIPRTLVHYIVDKYKKQNAFKILSAEAENVRPLYMYILTEICSEK